MLDLAYNNPQVHFNLDRNDHLSVFISDDALEIRSIQVDDLRYVYSVFSDPKVMKHFAKGQIKDLQYCSDRVQRFVEKFWQNNPYSGYVVFERKALNQVKFVGIAILGKSLNRGLLEYAVAIKPDSWGKGYGARITEIFLHTVAPMAKEAGYTIDGEQVRGVEATASVFNQPSNKMLQRAGMKFIERIEKYQGVRNRYFLAL